MNNIKKLLEEIQEEFDKLTVRWMHGETDIREVKSFIKESNLRVIDKVRQQVEESFENYMHYGIHGEPVKKPIMYVEDLKRLVLEDLSTIIEHK